MPWRQALALLTGLVFCLEAKAETLNLLIWESYIDQKLLEEWTTQTGVTVHQVLYDNGEMRDELLSDPDNDIDLVIISERQASTFGRRGVIEPLTDQNVSYLADYEPQWLDRCNGYGVPYLWGTAGILYRSDKVVQAPTSWQALLKPSPDLKGHIAMFDDNTDAFIAPLMLLGASLNTTDESDLRAAFEVLKTQAPFVRTYEYVISSTQNESFGDDLYMAFGYSGDQFVLNGREGTPGLWRYVVPEEGTMSWVDCMSVVAKSSKKAMALKLLEHIGSAEGAAANSIALNMPTPNTEALALLPVGLRNDPAIYPPESAVAQSERLESMTAEALQTRRRIVNALITFHDSH
jgi:spermidine/putrescine transport system substrate-binding protein